MYLYLQHQHKMLQSIMLLPEQQLGQVLITLLPMEHSPLVLAQHLAPSP